jgi:carboxypeptidase Taq
MNAHYETLLKLSRQIHLLEGVSSILEWDQETHMPPEGAMIRAEQLELLAGLLHERKTSSNYSSALGKLIGLSSGNLIAKELSEDQQIALKLFRKDYLQDTALPTPFVEKLSKLTSQSVEAWRYAKQKNSFLHFLPYLDQIVEMNKQKADYLGFKEHPYDALLDLYEPDLTTADVTALFTDLKVKISGLLRKIEQAPPVDDHFLFGHFPRDKQIEFAKVLLESMGYDKAKGRLDFSVHPFSSASHPTDSRITTFIYEDSLMSSIFSVLHEAGHGLYEMGLPHEHFGSPLCESLSLGMHESQSRWWETLIGQSEPFWSFFLPKLKAIFNGSLAHVSLQDFYQGIHKVSPSFIRIDADEVTYPLHIVLRFEIERDLINGTLKVRDIPEAWNEQMKTLLGITPKTFSEGCLQDIHWAHGSIGYFPSYTLGNIYASHLFMGFEQQFPNWKKLAANGELLFIKQWLHDHVHCYGRMYTSKELLKKATGQAFSSKAYIDYLTNKYSAIYNIELCTKSQS